MMGQAQFTYTDEDMTATQRAGWTCYAHWRNLLIVYIGLAALAVAFLAAMNYAYGTRSVSTDPIFVIVFPAVTIVLCLGALLVSARNYGRQMLHGPNSRMLGAWSGSELAGEQAWAWDDNGLHLRSARGHADLSCNSVGAWLDTPKVLLLFPPGGRAFVFTLPKQVLEAGWQDAPKLLIWPFGGPALSLPKRALEAGEAGRIVNALRDAGVPERRRFGVISAKGVAAN